ncbi:MAG TPA: L-idonate 5-dehydrogenase [Spirochaetia bacterium]|nr:L-idonate 5-dehydrogenase [Spirochaetia bacterium]
MKAFVLHGREDVRLEERPRPEPAEGWALLQVARVGICGSDVHYFREGKIGDFVPTEPFVLGHEFSGIVAEAGSGAGALPVGARVAVDPSMNCGVCSFCRSGRYNLCEKMRYFGSASTKPPTDGAFSEFVAAPARNCHPLPDEVDDVEATLIEPLSVAMHGVLRSGTVSGKSVLITGGGTIGQLVLLVARAFGAETLALADIAAFPRDVAASAGADFVFDPADEDSTAKSVERVAQGFDVVLEASGSMQALAQALRLVKRGGTIVQIGTLPNPVQIPANLVMSKEISLLGSFRFAHVFAHAITLVAKKRIDVHPIVTHTVPFDRLGEGIRLAAGKQAVIKVHASLLR